MFFLCKSRFVIAKLLDTKALLDVCQMFAINRYFEIVEYTVILYVILEQSNC